MGWIGNILIVSGAWQIGHKRRWGFLLTISGALCWIAVGVGLGRIDLIAIEFIMSLVATRNFLKWGKMK